MREVVLGTAKVYGCRDDFDYQYAVDVTEKEHRCTEYAITGAESVAGVARVDSNIEPLMGGKIFPKCLKCGLTHSSFWEMGAALCFTTPSITLIMKQFQIEFHGLWS